MKSMRLESEQKTRCKPGFFRWLDDYERDLREIPKLVEAAKEIERAASFKRFLRDGGRLTDV